MDQAEGPITWYRVVTESDPAKLPFLDLYREVAEEIKRQEAARRDQPFWPVKATP
jgi:hypothetical protein